MLEAKDVSPQEFLWPELYNAIHPDVLDSNSDAAEHYRQFGRKENRSPHPLLHAKALALVAMTSDDGVPLGLLASFLEGDAECRFHPLVDIDYMRAQDPALVTAQDCFRAIADPSRALCIRPHPLFDPAFYRTATPSRHYENELIDYIIVNKRTGRPHPLFDGEYYMATGAAVESEGESTLSHYLSSWREWKGDVSPLVDCRFLNHQLMRMAPGYEASDRDPLSFALTHRVDCQGPLIHPHIDSRMIEGCFENLLLDFWQEPEAAQTAEVIKDCLAQKHAATEKRPWVSAIILNYRKHVYTFFSIAAMLSAFKGFDIEVIIVENGGENFYYEYMLKYFHADKRIRFIKPKNNKFFGEGNNIGIDRASGKYLLLLNNDCFLMDDYGYVLDKHLRALPGSHVVGALLSFPDGSIQEFGGLVSDCGQVIQRAKHLPAVYMVGRLDVEKVDYASAACIVISREAMDSVAGFDLLFEPFYYEDTDLCRRLRQATFEIVVHPQLRAIHIENASTLEKLGTDEFRKMIQDHKQAFARRWFKDRGQGAYVRGQGQLTGGTAKLRKVISDKAHHRPSAIIYTPFDIKTGGGERYLLATAKALSERYDIIICSNDCFSRARVLHVLAALGIPEFPFRTCEDIANIRALTSKADVLFAMGNEIIPPVMPVAQLNLFHLQFPFPWRHFTSYNFNLVEDYDAIIVNSEFTKRWTAFRMEEVGVRNPPPIIELSPPVRLIPHRARVKVAAVSAGISIITVGRFFIGGHSKRQDVFLRIIELARLMTKVPIKATIIGSVHDAPDARAYFESVVKLASTMKDVEIIVDAPVEVLDAALQAADVYVHCAGYGLSVGESPEKMEHFGISIVEAIQAGCIPLVYDAGGARDVVARAKVGFVFKTSETAANRLVRLCDPTARHLAMAGADASWITNVLEPAFAVNLLKVIDDLRRREKTRVLNAGI